MRKICLLANRFYPDLGFFFYHQETLKQVVAIFLRIQMFFRYDQEINAQVKICVLKSVFDYGSLIL